MPRASAKTPKNFLDALSRPAAAALAHYGYTTLEKLSKLTEKEVLGLHGIGPGSLPTLRRLLKAEGLGFKPR
ncbi:MAG: hypothetical protein JNK82_13975 [Myxococcaceae bacterium]|nr:hypothetical protein [Myxococcaceae bacterium]